MKKLFSHPRWGAVICGAYGMENAGDDGVLAAIVAQLRRIDNRMPITVMARRPKATARRFGIKAVHPLNLPGWLMAMGRAKLFISGGGTLLQDVTSRRSLWFYLFTMRMAKKLGCSVQLYGCGVGPLREERSQELAAATVDACADAVTLRDGDSLTLLRDLGVERPRLLLSADPALSLPPAAVEREKCIGFALRDWPGFWGHVPDFAAAARYAYENYRLTPVFLCLAPEDRRAARSVCAALGDTPCSVSVNPRRAGRMNLVVSMRLHGLVFALRDGTPAAGVSYDPKVSAFCREAGLPCLLLDKVTEAGLCRLVDRAAHLDTEALRAQAERLKQRERVNGRVAAQLLAEGSEP